MKIIMGDNNDVKVRDVVCEMLIDLGTSLKEAEYNGEKYHFCSNDCQSRFLENPQKYLGKNRSKL